MLTFLLPTLEHTAKLGENLARLCRDARPLPFQAILLHGGLGSGKTTLTRSLVTALPGGEKAEVSSPSFTLCNAYPTRPEITHCDLYRCAASLPDEVWEALEHENILTIVEWAEYVPPAALPAEYLDIFLETCETGRLARVKAHGDTARQALEVLQHEDWTRT